MNDVSFLKKCLLIFFHPIDCFDIIKRERCKFKFLPVIILYLLASLMNYIYIFIVHFPLSQKSISSANILMELAMVTVPLLTWSVASYAITSIINGESKITELLTAYSYCLVPYVLFTPILGAISNFLGFNQAGVYFFIKYVVLLWTLFLMFLSLKHLNDYKLWQTVFIAFLSILLMIIIWAVILLLASLTVQFFSFFKDVYLEIIYKL